MEGANLFKVVLDGADLAGAFLHGEHDDLWGSGATR
ncbi:MAG: hypothetical protein ACREFS_09380 [Acetobacteraceae bacterium]